LYLNIYRPNQPTDLSLTNNTFTNATLSKHCPSIANTSLLPVAVWIHGGGLFMGGTADQRYNASFIIQKSVAMQQPLIVISLQYRLSAWGFLGGSEALAAGATNLGYRDQRLALHWIHENIATFGGDPTKVTLWERAQGLRVLVLSYWLIMVSSSS
jgi:carboxylesterase type B